MRVLLVALVLPATAVAGDAIGTARYAPVQLELAQESLQQAREAALMGQLSLAGRLAWVASLDARLAWGMSESAAVRIPAARVFGEATRLVHETAQAR